MDLIVEGNGIFVGKHQGRLRVTQDGKTLCEAPIIHLQQVLLVGTGIAISSDVFFVCAEEGIPIHLLRRSGRALGGLYSAGLGGTILTRRAQLAAYTDARGVMIARAFVAGKIENQRALLRYIGKYRKEAAPDLFQELALVAAELGDHTVEAQELAGDHIEEMRGAFLSVEGRAADHYWRAIKRVIPATLGWHGRETRGAIDPFNAALNYGYGVLYSQIERGLILAGLDPYGGFLHADRPGKPSLVLGRVCKATTRAECRRW